MPILTYSIFSKGVIFSYFIHLDISDLGRPVICLKAFGTNFPEPLAISAALLFEPPKILQPQRPAGSTPVAANK